ncbi:hypothetical protein HYQ44_002403 [Verticillium longisporum]|nr:hypothetical protein HYQ44_002403 [Verticillium longisporum]
MKADIGKHTTGQADWSSRLVKQTGQADWSSRLVKLAEEEALKLAKAGPTARRAFRRVGALGGSEEEKRGEGQREEGRLPKGVVRDDAP